jgi:tripartite-type tricarboxylate transporter receptor subunit TctC
MNRASSCFAAGLALFAASTSAFAQAYPTRPIRVIVPYPAGGIVDIVARSVTDTVAKNFKQAMVVEAKPGGNSNIGTAEVARSAPDGYTWLVTGPAVLVNPSIYKDAGWNAMRDFKCVGLVVWKRCSGADQYAGQDAEGFCRTCEEQAGQVEFRQSRHRLLDRPDREEPVQDCGN